MAKKKRIPTERRREIRDTISMMRQAEKADCNEAETRRRIERIFESVMGYDVFKNLSRERAVRGAGETEHVDFAIEIDRGDEVTKPEIMVEIKRINVNLAQKHLKQVSSYAINAGTEWLLLTNGAEWKLYHVQFGQPPITKHISTWNLFTDEIDDIHEGFELVSYRNVKRGNLDKLWEKTNILNPRNLLEAMLDQGTLGSIRRYLRKESGVSLAPEDIVAGIRRLLNEIALTELADVRITFDKPKRKKRTPKKKEEESTDAEAETSTDPNLDSSNEIDDAPGQEETGSDGDIV